MLLAPFEVFSRTIFAEAWFPDLVGWAAAALAIDLGLLILILSLDANYLELAGTISQKVYEQLRRTKQGGGIAMPVSSRCCIAPARSPRFTFPASRKRPRARIRGCSRSCSTITT